MQIHVVHGSQQDGSSFPQAPSLNSHCNASLQCQTAARRQAHRHSLKLLPQLSLQCQTAASSSLSFSFVRPKDLKPANLLISPSGVLKIADFGLARVWQEDAGRPLSHAVATR